MEQRIHSLEREVLLLKNQMNVIVSALEGTSVILEPKSTNSTSTTKKQIGVVFINDKKSNAEGFDNVTAMLKQAFQKTGIVNAEVHVVFSSGARADAEKIKPSKNPAIGIVYGPYADIRVDSSNMKWFIFETDGTFRRIKQNKDTDDTLQKIIQYLKVQNTNCAICKNADLFCVLHN